MERDIIHEDEVLLPEDKRLEERLGRYWQAQLGEPSQAADVWYSIAGRLGDQEGRESVDFARTLNILYGEAEEALPEPAVGIQNASQAPKKSAKPRRARSGWRLSWGPSFAAGAVLAGVGILVLLLVITANMTASVNHTGTLSASPTRAPGLSEIPIENPGFEQGFYDWYKRSDAQSFSIDQSVRHGGISSLSIMVKSPEHEPGPVSKNVRSQELREGKVRLSGYIKTQDVMGGASLFIRVTGPQVEGKEWFNLTAFDNMTDRAPSGTTDWTRYDLVVDVPKDVTGISFGTFLLGTGQMWVDDMKLEWVDKSVAATDQYSHLDLHNTDFEEGTRWWSIFGSVVTQSVDRTTAHNGQASIMLDKASGDPEDVAGFNQIIKAQNYAGKRVRFSAYLKTTDVDERAVLTLGSYYTLVLTQIGRTDSNPAYGSTDWQRYEVVMDIPADSTTVAAGVEIYGAGKVWIDDAKLEIVGNDVSITNPPIQEALSNGTFENGLQDWQLVSSRPNRFEANTGAAQAYSENQGAYLRSMEGLIDRTASLQQIVNVEAYQGKNIRLTAWINGDKVEEDARLFAAIYEPLRASMPMKLESHIPTNPRSNEQGWQPYAILMYIPSNAEHVTVGVTLKGSGEVWIDSVTLSEVQVSETPERFKVATPQP